LSQPTDVIDFLALAAFLKFSAYLAKIQSEKVELLLLATYNIGFSF